MTQTAERTPTTEAENELTSALVSLMEREMGAASLGEWRNLSEDDRLRENVVDALRPVVREMVLEVLRERLS